MHIRIESRSVGAELRLALPGDLQARAGLTLQQAREQGSGVELINAPRGLRRAALTRPFADWVTAGAVVLAVGDRKAHYGDAVRTDVFAVIDVTLSGGERFGRFDRQLFVKNLSKPGSLCQPSAAHHEDDSAAGAVAGAARPPALVGAGPARGPHPPARDLRRRRTSVGAGPRTPARPPPRGGVPGAFARGDRCPVATKRQWEGAPEGWAPTSGAAPDRCLGARPAGAGSSH